MGLICVFLWKLNAQILWQTAKVLHPGVQETHMLHTFTSLLTPQDQRKYKLSTPALKHGNASICTFTTAEL